MSRVDRIGRSCVRRLGDERRAGSYSAADCPPLRLFGGVAVFFLLGCPGAFELEVPTDAGPAPMPTPGNDPFQCGQPVAAPRPFNDGFVNWVGSGRRGTCTTRALRSALENGGDIRFDCGPGLHVFEVERPLRVSVDTTFVDGEGVITIAAADASETSIFEIDGGISELVLRGLTLSRGNAARGGVMTVPANARVWLDQVSVKDNTATGATAPGVAPVNGGGAIAVREAGELAVLGSTFRDNKAGYGGAIWVQGRAAFHRATFNQNFADMGVGHGGALAIEGRVWLCAETSFTDNRAFGSGGAIFANGAEAQVHDTYFEINSAQARQTLGGGMGGAIASRDTELVIARATFEANSAALHGGAIEQRAGRLSIHNSTLFENAASRGSGGAVALQSATADFVHVTLLGNTAATVAGLSGTGEVTIRNSIFSARGAEVCEATYAGRHVLQSTGSLCTSDATVADDVGLSAQLEGGVIPLLAGSAAVGAGQDCLPEDQRGQPRPSSGCDLGAYEMP